MRDIEGGLWDVRDVRATKHGFDLFFGSPVSRLDGYRAGRPHLIPTQELFDYWEARKTRGHGTIHDLPMCPSTGCSMRRRFGFHYFDNRSKFWQDHAGELKNMTAQECADHLGVDIQDVYARRRTFEPRLLRPSWWLLPENRAILLAHQPLREMAKQLGVCISVVCEMRKRVRTIARNELDGQILLAA